MIFFPDMFYIDTYLVNMHPLYTFSLNCAKDFVIDILYTFYIVMCSRVLFIIHRRVSSYSFVKV